MPDVVVTLRGREISRVSIEGRREITVGRDASCDVPIDSPGISRVHAIIECEHGRYRVIDQDSQNGITVGGQRVRQVELSFGHDDGVEIGKFRLQVLHSANSGGPPAMTPAKATSDKPPPRNVLNTVALDDAAAKAIQARLAARGGQPLAPLPRNRPQRAGSPRDAWLWVGALMLAAATGAWAWLLLR